HVHIGQNLQFVLRVACGYDALVQQRLPHEPAFDVGTTVAIRSYEVTHGSLPMVKCPTLATVHQRTKWLLESRASSPPAATMSPPVPPASSPAISTVGAATKSCGRVMQISLQFLAGKDKAFECGRLCL